MAPILGGEGCNPPTGDGVDLTLGDLVFGDFRDFGFFEVFNILRCIKYMKTIFKCSNRNYK